MRLAISAQKHFGPSIEEQLYAFKKAGFDGFFTPWDENLLRYREIADELQMEFVAVHAPTASTYRIWDEDLSEEYIRCVRDTAAAGVEILIMHAYTEPAMSYKYCPRDVGPASEAGISYYRKVMDEAKKLGVKVAFENAEGEEQLHAVMRAFSDYDNLGYCWDSGHEFAYAEDIDYLSLYGDKLLITHLNDNMGCRGDVGMVSGIDDMHLLPFDGKLDWNKAVSKLKKYKLPDILTFEFKMNPLLCDKRHEQYKNLSFEEYLSLAHERARKVADMLEA